MKKLILFISFIILYGNFIAQVQTEKLVDIDGVERNIFYHISYNGGLPSGKNSQMLYWYTHKELPNTYFIIEQYNWNKWVKRGKYTGKGMPGSGKYAGKIEGKYMHKLKVPPHSGENRWRVLLMNDSNICLGVSKELIGTDSKGEPIAFVPKADHTLNKKTKEISFSDETYFELYDPSGKLIEEGRGKTIICATLDPGIYTLNYDNSTATIKLK